jgi:hypothetical protein
VEEAGTASGLRRGALVQPEVPPQVHASVNGQRFLAPGPSSRSSHVSMAAVSGGCCTIMSSAPSSRRRTTPCLLRIESDGIVGDFSSWRNALSSGTSLGEFTVLVRVWRGPQRCRRTRADHRFAKHLRPQRMPSHTRSRSASSRYCRDLGMGEFRAASRVIAGSIGRPGVAVRRTVGGCRNRPPCSSTNGVPLESVVCLVVHPQLAWLCMSDQSCLAS